MINVRRDWIRVLCNRISRNGNYGGTSFEVYWIHFIESVAGFVMDLAIMRHVHLQIEGRDSL